MGSIPQACSGNIDYHSIINSTKVPHVQNSEPSNYRLKVKHQCQAHKLQRLQKSQEEEDCEDRMRMGWERPLFEGTGKGGQQERDRQGEGGWCWMGDGQQQRQSG